MKKIGWTLLILLVFACSKSSPTEPTLGAWIKANVREATTHEGIAGAVIEAGKEDGPAVLYTGTTDANGAATIAVSPGGYWIRVLPPTGYTYSPFSMPTVHTSAGEGGTMGLVIEMRRQ